MGQSMDDLYRKAKRFDEGDIYQSQEYQDVCARQIQLYEKLRRRFGAQITPLLEEYTAAIGDECDLENRHFFAQGYRLGILEESGRTLTEQER